MNGSLVPVVIAIKIRRYKEAFRVAGATTPERAIRPADAGLRESLIFRKLVRHRILVAAGNDRFYLDEARDAVVMHSKRKLLAVLLLFIVVLLIGGIIAAWQK